MNIYETISETIDYLQGDFVVPKNAYEKDFCGIFGWTMVDSRYYDACTMDDEKIEIKKGQSQMWFNLVRYAEIVSGKGEQNTYTLFIKWNKKFKLVEECYIIDTKDIINFFGLSKKEWKRLRKIDKKLPRRLNAQASMYYTDMKKIASHIVYSKWAIEKQEKQRLVKRKRSNTDSKQHERSKKIKI
jgi:hypothetical protein